MMSTYNTNVAVEHHHHAFPHSFSACCFYEKFNPWLGRGGRRGDGFWPTDRWGIELERWFF